MPGHATQDLLSTLAVRPYPGRGVAVGADAAGVGFAAYWLTGRSEASRARTISMEHGSIAVVDTSGRGSTDELRHYTAAISTSENLLIGNGTHVAGLHAGRRGGTPVEVGLNDLDFEPDAPIRTPRISAYVTHDHDGTIRSALASATSSVPARPDTSQRRTLHVSDPDPGTSLAVMTYTGTVEPPTADGHPTTTSTPVAWTSLAQAIWDALDERFRVGVVVFPVHALSQATIISRDDAPRA